MIDAHRQAFKEEAYELLAELETSLLELEDRPDDAELIGRVFRAMHTIKGSGAMFGFDDIAAFTHEVETVFDHVRNGRLEASKQLIGLSLQARDHIKLLLDSSDSPSEVNPGDEVAIIAGLKALLPMSEEKTASQAAPQATVSPLLDSASVTFRIRFKPAADIFANGANPLALLDELAELGACKIVAQMSEMPTLMELNPEACYVYWDVILTTTAGIDAIRDVFIFVEDDCDLKIEVIDEGGTLDSGETYKRLGEILVERGDITAEDLDVFLKQRKRLGEMLVESGMVKEEKVQAALFEQEQVTRVRKERQAQSQAQDSISSIRVPADKLDILVNLVGELVTVQAHLTQLAASREDSELNSVAEEVERLTAEMRDNTLNIRMLPIGTTFSKFKRLVRDLSQELGKEVDMTTDGAETELDKTVIERLNDPLVHLIRNSIDHGIEMPDVRERSGKPRLGTVHLSAEHSGDSVLVRIRDDGAGLDKEAIRAKAEERGLIAAGAELSEKEIYSLIFAPGFSTAKAVTSVSGRGVGMDVVKRAIDALRGSIDISSKRGEGTTITVKIPLTLAIIESLLVKIGQDSFVLPLSMVEECIELTREDVSNAHGRNLANVRGQVVPYIPLRQMFNIGDEPPEIEQIVVTHVNGMRVGLVVDNVIGEHQTVIKTLGKMYKDIEGLSGATILGDGTVALILDIPHLVRSVEADEQYLH